MVSWQLAYIRVQFYTAAEGHANHDMPISPPSMPYAYYREQMTRGPIPNSLLVFRDIYSPPKRLHGMWVISLAKFSK